MDIGSIAAAPPADTPTKPDTTMGNDVFMTLLVAQLKAQNPLEPLDPSQFVSQLVEFNTLDQLIQIREAVESEPIHAGPIEPGPIEENPAGEAADLAPALSE